MSTTITIPDQIKRVAVTGASGFLGSEVVKLLREQNIDVVCTGRRLGGDAFLPNYHIVDFADEKFSGKFLENCDVVINCAGSVHNKSNRYRSATTPFRVNSDAALRLAELAAQYKIKKFIQISTVSIYGECFPLKTEADIPAPNNMYGESNLDAETRLFKFCENESLDLTVLRLTTLYGAGDPGNIGKLIGFLAKPYAFALGEGRNKKSLIHVTDAARSIVAALSQPLIKTEKKIFNISNDPIEVREIYKSIRDTMNLSYPPVISDKFINFWRKILSPLGQHLPGVQKILDIINKITRDDLVDGQKFKQAYNFKPIKSLDTGLTEEVNFITRKNSKKYISKRIFDIFTSSIALVLLFLPLIILSVLIKVTSKGPAIYWSDRIGKNNKIFKMAKFRSMRTETPELATHLLSDSHNWVTPIGKIMRKTSLDELPQLWHILQGKMSFVGPRPALFNQDDLIIARTALQVDTLMPGITGLAQISGRDELSIFEKVLYDRKYLTKRNLIFDIKIIIQTFLKVFTGKGIMQADNLEAQHNLHDLYEVHPENELNLYGASSLLLGATLAREKLLSKDIPVGVFSIRNFEKLHEKEFSASDFILCFNGEDKLVDKSISANLVCLPETQNLQPPYYSHMYQANYIVNRLENFLKQEESGFNTDAPRPIETI